MLNEKSIADLQIMSGMKLIHDGCEMRDSCENDTVCPFRDFCITATDADCDLHIPMHWTDEYILRRKQND